MIEKLKIDTNNASDIIYKDIKISNKIITVVYSEVLTSSENITGILLRNISHIIEEDLFS